MGTFAGPAAALATLEGAGLRVRAYPDGRLSVAPLRLLTPELRVLIRDHKRAILDEYRAAHPATIAELQARGALSAGEWREIPAPDWAPPEAPGCPRRWFAGPGDQLVSVT